MPQSRIRNFSIIAHIDHGKSTLADRFIQMCGGLPEREMAEQVLDTMDLERERGITIKAQTAALEYRARDGETYLLNLIDTPGHVDFSYEVSRSLAACEGAVRVMEGTLRPKDRIRLMSSGAAYICDQVGVFTPKAKQKDRLSAGEVGYVTAGIKELRAAKVGDTLTHDDKPAASPLPGFKEIKPQVFAGLYPVEASEYEALRDALEKLHLNDASFHYEPETSQALGFGFRCGFLGLLHMDIVQERLEREYGMHLITTAPSVVYEVLLRDGSIEQVSNPARLPDPALIEEIREPVIATKIFVPQEYVGPVITLCTDKRGTQTNLHYSARHVVISYDLPLNEVVLDFFDRLKSMTRGYGSLDYEFRAYRSADMVRLDILVNGERVDALSSMVHRETAQLRGRDLVTRLRGLIPRQMFDVAVQAAIGGHIIARENVKALRKNVLAKCYGGDVTRKRKLLEKQKAGKKRMKQVGSVEIPQEAFLAVLQRSDS